MQRVVEISYRRFGTTYRFLLKGQSSVKKTFENGTDMLTRNVSKELPLRVKKTLEDVRYCFETSL